jgi:F0F1-type ATP synthase membrane subunit b/b'
MAGMRKRETEEERSERLKMAAQELHDARDQEGDALDAMVRKSIKLYGP